MATQRNSTLELVSEAPEVPLPEFLRQQTPPPTGSSAMPGAATQAVVNANMLAVFKAMALVLAARMLLLLAVLSASLLSGLAVMDQSIQLPKMIMVGVFDALLIFPLVMLNLRKG